MEIYAIDGALMRSRETVHEYLQQTLQFPDYYGRNLDALYDMLTSMDAAMLMFCNVDQMLDALGEYGEKLLETMTGAVEENPDLTLLCDSLDAQE